MQSLKAWFKGRVTYIQKCHFWMVLPGDDQHEVTGAVEEPQGGRQLAVCKAVESQVHLRGLDRSASWSCMKVWSSKVQTIFGKISLFSTSYTGQSTCIYVENVYKIQIISKELCCFCSPGDYFRAKVDDLCGPGSVGLQRLVDVNDYAGDIN